MVADGYHGYKIVYSRSDLIFDRDAKYGLEVPLAIRYMKVTAIQTSYQSPWQNGVAERWVESCRRDLLDRMIALNERHMSASFLSTFVTTIKIAHTSCSLSKRLPEERGQSLRPISSRTRDSEARVTGTSGPPPNASELHI